MLNQSIFQIKSMEINYLIQYEDFAFVHNSNFLFHQIQYTTRSSNHNVHYKMSKVKTKEPTNLTRIIHTFSEDSHDIVL